MITNYICKHDYGIFVLKYMELRNGATLRHALVEDKINYYQLKVVCTLVMQEAKREWDRIRPLCIKAK